MSLFFRCDPDHAGCTLICVTITSQLVFYSQCAHTPSCSVPSDHIFNIWCSHLGTGPLQTTQLKNTSGKEISRTETLLLVGLLSCVRPSTCHMIWRCLCVWTNMAGNHKFNNCGVNKCREPIPNKDQFKACFPQRVIRPGAPRLQPPHPPPSRSLSVHLMVVKWLKLSWVLWTHFFSEDFNLASSGTAQHLRTLSSGLSIAGCWAEGGGRSFL